LPGEFFGAARSGSLQWKFEDITLLYGVTVSARVVLWVTDPVIAVTVML